MDSIYNRTLARSSACERTELVAFCTYRGMAEGKHTWGIQIESYDWESRPYPPDWIWAPNIDIFITGYASTVAHPPSLDDVLEELVSDWQICQECKSFGQYAQLAGRNDDSVLQEWLGIKNTTNRFVDFVEKSTTTMNYLENLV